LTNLFISFCNSCCKDSFPSHALFLMLPFRGRFMRHEFLPIREHRLFPPNNRPCQRIIITLILNLQISFCLTLVKSKLRTRVNIILQKSLLLLIHQRCVLLQLRADLLQLNAVIRSHNSVTPGQRIQTLRGDIPSLCFHARLLFPDLHPISEQRQYFLNL